MDVWREHDDDDVRWYYSDDGKGLSVTQILSMALEEDETGLDIWKGRNDGQGDSPHWAHLFWYSGHRGTLCHYHALSIFGDKHDGGDMWGDEETSSIQALSTVDVDFEALYGDEAADASNDESDIVYSILCNRDIVTDREQYETFFEGSTTLIDIVNRDINWFVDTFRTVCETLGVTADDVISVEKFMLDTRVGYGGQCDMLYEDQNGDIVLADLKTSKALRHKHRLQSVAYKKSVEAAEDIPVDEVDRIEIWRMHPDSETWRVHSHTVPNHASDLGRYTTDNFFKDKWGEFEYDDIEDMWQTFRDLSTMAHEYADR